MNKKTLKSIGAVVAGFFTIVILSVLTDTILDKISAGYTSILIIPLIYRTIYAVLGGYVTAKFSPDKPMRHVLILNIIGGILGTLGAVAGWNLSAHWYPISLVITSVLGVWFGGRLVYLLHARKHS